MPEQTITLAAGDLFRDTSSQKQWRASVLLDDDFQPGATARYFRRLIVRNTVGPSNFQYQMSFDETGVAPNTETASQLVDEWAEADVALTFAQGSNTLDVSGPNNANNEVQDATDNYAWSPPVNHVPFAGDFFFSLFDSSADLTITFKFPGPPPPPPPPPPPVVADYVLQVDWDNDGTYGNANADVWGKVVEGTFQCRRGRNFASQRIGRSVAGQLLVQLDNRDGLFDPDNTMGALSGLLGGGRRVQWQVNDGAGNLVEQWTGWLRDIRQRDQQTGFDRVTLRAWEVISLLVNDDKTVGQQTDIATGEAGQLLFDDVEDAAFYDPAYINGDRVMGRWWSDGPRWKALQDLEQTEAGFINVRKNGFIALDAASNRQSASSRVSQATFTDAIPAAGEIPAIANGIIPDHPREDLANIITSNVIPYSVGNQQVLWSVDDLAISAGADFSITAAYPDETSPRTHVGVDAWTPLAAGTDYTAQAGVMLTLTTEGNTGTIRIQNTGGATTMSIQLRGTPVVRGNPIKIITPDQDSIDEHREAPYPFNTPWLSDPAEVSSLHTFLLRIYAQPAERLALTWERDSDKAKAASLDLSHRLTVDRRAITDSYFIESILHRVTADFHFITYTLSPAGLYGEIFVLGVSRLGEGILAA